MTNKPIIHKYHFGDIRESIFSNLEWILTQKKLTTFIKPHGYVCVATIVNSNNSLDTCSIGIVLLPNGVVIHTSFPNQNDTHDRLWMIDNYIGRVAYIEITNPHLRNTYKFDIKDPSGNTYEMHAMPNDLALLNNLLLEIIAQTKNETITIASSPSKQLLQNIPD